MAKAMTTALVSGLLRAAAAAYARLLEEELQENLVAVILFGSVARSEATAGSDIDLLVVISAVSYVDRLIRRRRGTQWSRALVVRVPVYHPETWNRLAGHLSATLRLLSGDAWTFDFRQRQRPQQPQQFLPSLPLSFEGATVIPYSGGLDSFALLARVRHYEPDEKVLLVNARRSVVQKVDGRREAPGWM